MEDAGIQDILESQLGFSPSANRSLREAHELCLAVFSSVSGDAFLRTKLEVAVFTDSAGKVRSTSMYGYGMATAHLLGSIDPNQ